MYVKDLLSDFKRIHLCHQPTPLEEMPRLTAALGGPRLWIKRDDCTGLATGGNKTRKLEFLMAAAQDAGADIVVTQGAVQSNHVRQTAAAAAKLGMKCHAVLEGACQMWRPAMKQRAMCCLTICLAPPWNFGLQV